MQFLSSYREEDQQPFEAGISNCFLLIIYFFKKQSKMLKQVKARANLKWLLELMIRMINNIAIAQLWRQKNWIIMMTKLIRLSKSHQNQSK